jgi:hypothetical protein
MVTFSTWMNNVSKNTMIAFHELYKHYAKDVYSYACWLGGTSRLFDCQILVFHFPGVVQGVKGGVPN